MGVNTKGIIRNGTTVEELKTAIESKYGEVTVIPTGMDYFFNLIFKDGEDNRRLACFFSDVTFSDYGINGVLIDLNYWGNSVEIITYLTETFGGYVMKNDCSDEEWKPVNIQEFEKGKYFTKTDLFINKVISKLGYNNLKPAMELFNEFKEIK